MFLLVFACAFEGFGGVFKGVFLMFCDVLYFACGVYIGIIADTNRF